MFPKHIRSNLLLLYQTMMGIFHRQRRIFHRLRPTTSQMDKLLLFYHLPDCKKLVHFQDHLRIRLVCKHVMMYQHNAQNLSILRTECLAICHYFQIQDLWLSSILHGNAFVLPLLLLLMPLLQSYM